MNIEQYIQLGAVAIVFIFAIREFFAYLKSKNSKSGIDIYKRLETIDKTLTNHMCSYNRALGRMEEAISDIKEDVREIKNIINNK